MKKSNWPIDYFVYIVTIACVYTEEKKIFIHYDDDDEFIYIYFNARKIICSLKDFKR